MAKSITHTIRSLTPEEQALLIALRDTLWNNFSDEDTCAYIEGSSLSLDDWIWLRELVVSRALYAEIASGFTTPNPYVLCFDSTDEPSLIMIHPLHVPLSLGGSERASELFQEIQSQSATRSFS